MFIYVPLPYCVFNNVQLFLVFHEIILHIHNVHDPLKYMQQKPGESIDH